MKFDMRYSIKIHKGFFLLCSIFFILFLLLSSWQVHRYYEKKILLNTYQSRFNQLPTPFTLIRNEENLQFLSIAVDGEYDNASTMFVENQLHEGKLGFEVLTPLRIADSNKLLLVDRGWVPKQGSTLLPMITPVDTSQHITGYLKLFNEYQFILGKNIIAPDKKPLVMQRIDLQEISHVTKNEFYPYILRLDPEDANGFVREWVISSVLPERHIMYALQWLAFAIVVLIGFVYFSLEGPTHE